jgi:hypothetical protein
MDVRTTNRATLASALLVLACSAQAAPAGRFEYQTAASNCQGALPGGAGSALRARPLAIGNEGNVVAFVTCGFPDDSYYDHQRTTDVGARLSNSTAAAVSINCTLVSGYVQGPPIVYVPKTIAIPAGGSTLVRWSPLDVGVDETSIPLPQLSCALLPGTSLNYTYTFGTEEIGA